MKYSLAITGLFISTLLINSLFLSESCAQQNPRSSPWSMFGQNPQNTFQSPFAAPTQKPARPQWAFTSWGGHGISSPVAVGKDDTLYFGTWKNAEFSNNKLRGHSGVFMALTPQGEVKWSHDSKRGSFLASGIESSPVVLDNDMVIYGKDDGYVYCLDKHGRLVWEVPLDDPFNPQHPYDDNEQVIPSPVLGPDKTLYVCSHWGNVYNPDAVERILRRVPVAKRPQIDIQGTKQDKWGKLYAIDIRDGAIQWSYDPSQDPPQAHGKKFILGSPAISRTGTVYFSCYDRKNGYLYAVNPDGTLKWRYPPIHDNSRLKRLTSMVSVAEDGTLYAGSFDFNGTASVYAFSQSGELKWEYVIKENRITAGPSIGQDGTVYVGGINWGFSVNPAMSKWGHLYAIKPGGHTADLKWAFKVEYGINAPPVIDRNNHIFFATYSDPMIVGELGPYHVYAINAHGEKLWSYPLKGRVQPSVVIDKNGTLYVGTTQREANLYSFRGHTP